MEIIIIWHTLIIILQFVWNLEKIFINNFKYLFFFNFNIFNIFLRIFNNYLINKNFIFNIIFSNKTTITLDAYSIKSRMNPNARQIQLMRLAILS